MTMRFHQAMLISIELPWNEKEELIEDIFCDCIRDAIKKGFNNLYIFGTCGEGYAVDTRRFRQVVDIFAKEALKPGNFPQVGTIGLSTANIVERLGYAHEKGFRTFQISLPAWGALDDNELMQFFKDVCGTFKDSKFLHYNNGRSKRVLSGSDYRRLADAVPNLVATKNGGTIHTVADLMRNVPDLQHFWDEYNFPYGCLYGECSLLSSYGIVSPTKTRTFFELGKNKKIEELFKMLKETVDAWQSIFSPTNYRSAIDGAYDKMLVKFVDARMPLRLLSPYQCFPDDVFQKCHAILNTKYANWLG